MRRAFTIPEVLIALMIFAIALGSLGTFQSSIVTWNRSLQNESLIVQQQRIGLEYLAQRLSYPGYIVSGDAHSFRYRYCELAQKRQKWKDIWEDMNYTTWQKYNNEIWSQREDELFFLEKIRQPNATEAENFALGLFSQINSKRPIVYYFGNREEDLEIRYYNVLGDEIIPKRRIIFDPEKPEERIVALQVTIVTEVYKGRNYEAIRPEQAGNKIKSSSYIPVQLY